MASRVDHGRFGWCNGMEQIEHSFLHSLSLRRRNPQYKKHKTWDGDGVLVVKGTFFDLLDVEDGRRCVASCVSWQPLTFLSRLSCGKPSGVEPDKLGEGSEFVLNGKDVMIDHAIKPADYFSGSCFANGVVVQTTEPSSNPALRNSATAAKQFTPLKPRNGNYKAPSFVHLSVASSSKEVVPAASHQESRTGGDGRDEAVKNSYWMVNW